MNIVKEFNQTKQCKFCGKTFVLRWKSQPSGPMFDSNEMIERLANLTRCCDSCGDFFFGMSQVKRRLSSIASVISINPDNAEKYRKKVESICFQLEKLVAARFHCKQISSAGISEAIIKNPVGMVVDEEDEKKPQVLFWRKTLSDYIKDIEHNMNAARPRTNDD